MSTCRILILHSSAELYGSDRSLASLARALSDEGIGVHVVLPEGGPLVSVLQDCSAHVSIGDVGVLRRKMLARRALRLAVILIRGARLPATNGQLSGFQAIVTNTSAVLGAYRLASRSRTPHIVILRESLRSGAEGRFIAWLVGRASSVVAVSDSIKAELIGIAPRLARKSVVHYSGAETTEWLREPRMIEQDDPIRILCVGRLNQWKGQDLLLEALSELRKRNVVFQGKIVGGEYGGAGNVTSNLRSTIESYSLPVELSGEFRNVDTFYRWADVVVVPSKRREPFGKVVVEALAHQCVVVASDQGGPSEVIRHELDGLLFRMGSSSDLADSLERIAEDNQLRINLSLNAKIRAQEFDSRVTARRLANHIQSVARQSGP